MLLVIGGIFGSLIAGYILDKSKAYKYVEMFRFSIKKAIIYYEFIPFFFHLNRIVTVGVYFLSFLSMTLFTSTISLHEYIAFVTMTIVG